MTRRPLLFIKGHSSLSKQPCWWRLTYGLWLNRWLLACWLGLESWFWGYVRQLFRQVILRHLLVWQLFISPLFLLLRVIAAVVLLDAVREVWRELAIVRLLEWAVLEKVVFEALRLGVRANAGADEVEQSAETVGIEVNVERGLLSGQLLVPVCELSGELALRVLLDDGPGGDQVAATHLHEHEVVRAEFKDAH